MGGSRFPQRKSIVRPSLKRVGGIAVSRIFLSHSSANNDQLYDWLQRQGWRNEVFLDLDPIRDIFLREVLMNEKTPALEIVDEDRGRDGDR